MTSYANTAPNTARGGHNEASLIESGMQDMTRSFKEPLFVQRNFLDDLGGIKPSETPRGVTAASIA
jgi:hypothetical protein